MVGTALIGASSGTSRTVISYTNPDLEPETGDLVYTENGAPVLRALGQGELIKIAPIKKKLDNSATKGVIVGLKAAGLTDAEIKKLRGSK